MYETRTFDTKHPSPRDRSGASDLGVRSRGLAPWRIRRLKAFVEEHLSQSIRLVDLSDVVGLSLPQFSRAFGQSFGEPPHVYLIQRRLDRARHLMLTSDIKLIEVACACGFSYQAHFCNLFRRDTGRTPAAWRRERRDGRGEIHEIEMTDLDLPQGPAWGGSLDGLGERDFPTSQQIMTIIRHGACGLVLAAALLAGPTAAREIMPTSQAELIRGLIPSVVNITVRTRFAEVPDQARTSASPPRRQDRRRFWFRHRSLRPDRHQLARGDGCGRDRRDFLRRHARSGPGRGRLAGGRSWPFESGCGPPAAGGPLGR